MNEQASGQNPAQGWYTDPHNASQLRWWDGAAWTDRTHPPAAESPVAAPAAETEAQPAAPAATPAAQPAAAATPAAQTQTSASPGAGGIVSNPAPKAAGSGGSGQKGAVAEWFSIRTNQVLFAVLVVAIILFVIVMAGGGS